MRMYDLAIVGGDIVGLSCAWQLKRRYPDAAIVLIEKEAALAQHQTCHNSGVIHAGVYYQPGSLKADFCKRGAEQTMAFCRAHCREICALTPTPGGWRSAGPALQPARGLSNQY